jgi:type I phosphodiesterase/nucleotide pyrophosphatase
VRDQGVNFANSHSVFPTLTMVNAAAMGTSHFPGETRNFANTIYTGFAVQSANGSVAPMIENDAMLAEINDHFCANYLNEESVLAAAPNQGFLTAAVGKVWSCRSLRCYRAIGRQTIVVDDLTGRPGGVPLSDHVLELLQAANLPNQAPTRGNNAKVGDMKTPGTSTANIDQQRYFVEVATKVILPIFKASGKPFVLIFWSRDPARHPTKSRR